jgi:hypothetical protein
VYCESREQSWFKTPRGGLQNDVRTGRLKVKQRFPKGAGASSRGLLTRCER